MNLPKTGKGHASSLDNKEKKENLPRDERKKQRLKSSSSPHWKPETNEGENFLFENIKAIGAKIPGMCFEKQGKVGNAPIISTDLQFGTPGKVTGEM